MIHYDLICDKGHAFDGWFRDSAAYDEQRAQGFVACPFCGSDKVEKAIMAPRIARTDRDEAPIGTPTGDTVTTALTIHVDPDWMFS